MSKKFGALPSQFIKVMMEGGRIKGGCFENIQPASLDLTLSPEIFRLEGIFQPQPGEPVREILNQIGASPFSFDSPLEVGVTYLARLQEFLALPDIVYGYSNPKSSTGRNDVQVRVLADGVPRYDAAAPSGFTGELWLAIEPKSFPIKLAPGETLSQMRFFNQDTRLEESELQLLFESEGLLYSRDGQPLKYHEIKIRDNDGSVILTADLSGEIIGWECLGTKKVLDFSKRNYYQPEEFFRPLTVSSGRLYLRQGGFYILRTKERVRVPPRLACEIAPMDVRSGEFRSHYAGFVDPGWGWGKDGQDCGRPLILELRPFEPLLIRSGQAVAKVKFEHMVQIPEILYDSKEVSHYGLDTIVPRLSKHFKQEG